jgi:hypothetical protein
MIVASPFPARDHVASPAAARTFLEAATYWIETAPMIAAMKRRRLFRWAARYQLQDPGTAQNGSTAGWARSRVRAAYNRNTKSGAWLYPIPPDASPQTVDWDAFLGPAPRRPYSLERFFRWRCYWDYSGGLATDLFVHLLTTIHYLLDAKMPARVTGSGQNYRYKETHEVPDTLNAILEYRRASVVLGYLQQRGGGIQVLGANLFVLRDGKVELRRAPVEGNGWIGSRGRGAGAYYADRGGRRGGPRRGRLVSSRVGRLSRRWGRTPPRCTSPASSRPCAAARPRSKTATAATRRPPPRIW